MGTHIEAISAMESTTVSIVMHTPRKTQTLPAGPPLASDEALVLDSSLVTDNGLQFEEHTSLQVAMSWLRLRHNLQE